MSKNHVWVIAKVFEGLGMVLVLIGLVLSIELGTRDESMESQWAELSGLLIGLLLFGVGFVLERFAGTR